LQLLQRLRDEAHRFSVAYHHHLRGARLQASALDEIEGVGPARREALLRLVDPVTLGDFRWVAFARGPLASEAALPCFLRDPEPVEAAPAA
jgi:hypothetical protein